MAAKSKRVKIPNGAGSVILRSDGRWMARYSTADPDTGLPVSKALCGRTGRGSGRSRPRTLDQYGERWLAGAQVRVKTTIRYQELLRRHVLPSLGRPQLVRLEPQHVEGLLRAKHGAGLAAKTCNHPGHAADVPQRRDARGPRYQKRRGPGETPPSGRRQGERDPDSGAAGSPASRGRAASGWAAVGGGAGHRRAAVRACWGCAGPRGGDHGDLPRRSRAATQVHSRATGCLPHEFDWPRPTSPSLGLPRRADGSGEWIARGWERTHLRHAKRQFREPS